MHKIVQKSVVNLHKIELFSVIMRIERDIIETLRQWKDAPNRKLSGARQIGKTWALETFGKGNFKYCAHFDFDRQAELKTVFQTTKEPERI